MVHLDALSLGLTLVLVAGVILLLVLRFFARASSRPAAPEPAFTTAEPSNDHANAVLVIQAGGKPVFANRKARELFHLRDGELPNLERLARRIRPAGQFLSLCSSDQSAQIVLDGRLLEGTSYHLAFQPNPLTVVTLRDPGLTANLASGEGGMNSRTVQTFVELTQTMAASLELETTIQTILENIEKLVPADWMEITIWDANQEILIPYRFTGLETTERRLEISTLRYRVGEGYSGLLAKDRQPILLPDIDARPEIRPAVDRSQIPLRAYLGVPLLIGGEFVGTLELASMTSGAFRPEDLEVVKMLSGQAAVAIHNALMYQAEQQRTAELSGLAQLSQAFGSARDPKTLYDRLVQSILPLIKVEILGFLLYNETTRTLESQAPFFGLPDPFLDLYNLPVQPNSALEQALMGQDVLMTSNAAEDPGWESLGLAVLARGASLRETVLVPLSSGGRMLGYLQASNHSTPTDGFNQDELHLLMIVANQAAPVIDNLTLIQQQRQRAQRAESLRRIASFASSAANLEEILRFSLQELARLLNAEVAGFFLYDQAASELQFQEGSMFGSLEPLPERLGRLRVDDPQYHFTVTGSQRALFTGSLSEEAAVVPFYKAVQEFWKIESAVIVPLVVRDEGIGELWLASSQVNCFDKGGLQVAATAAGQLGGVVEQSYLVAQTDDSFRRRVEHLSSLTRINRELSVSPDLNYLLQLVLDEAVQNTRADCGAIYIFDLDRPTPGGPRTRFTIGDEPRGELHPLEKQALESGEPFNVSDVLRYSYPGSHEGIHSALLVPVVFQGQKAGLMVLHSKLPHRFDNTSVEIAQTLAVQAAVVLGNALKHDEQAHQGEVLKRELDTLSKLFDLTRTLGPETSLPDAMKSVAQAISGATPFQMVVMSLYDADSASLQRVTQVGVAPDAWTELQARRQPWEAIQALLTPEFKIGSVYYIPADRRPAMPEELHTVTLLPKAGEAESQVWNPKDMLLAPLYAQDGSPLGMISVDGPRDGRRPDWQTFETLQLFALHASMMTGARLQAQQLTVRAADLEAEMSHLQQENQQVMEKLPALESKAQQQAQAVAALERHVERMHNSLEVAEQANRQPNSQAVLMTVARELLGRFGMQVAVLGEISAAGPQLVDIIGLLPQNTNPRVLFGQRNPLRHALQERALMLVPNIEADSDWKDNSFLRSLGAKSFIALPLNINERQAVAVLVAGTEPLPPFSEEDTQAFQQVVRQVSVGLQNLELLTQTRRRLREMDILLEFSRKLGSFTPAEILRSLLDSAMQILPAAQAGWAGLHDPRTSELTPQVALGYSDNSSVLCMCIGRLPEEGAAESDRLPLPLRAYADGKAQRKQEVQFARDYNLPPEDLLFYRRATGGRLPVSTLVVPVQLSGKTLGVLVLENFNSQAVFTEEDENLSLSLTQQAALALENARLLQSAEGRAAQLQALTRVAGTITTSLRSEDLIASLLDQLKEVMPYNTATLWLRKGSELSVAAASGFEDNSQLLGLSVAVEDSQLFHEMASTGQPICVPDIRRDPRFPSLAEPERISWLGIPLIAKGQLTGVIAIEKTEADFYSDEHVRAATTFASQAAVALDNARLFEESERRAAELDERSSRLALLNRLSGNLGASLDVEYILDLTATEMRAALNVQRVSAVMIDEASKLTVRAESPLWAEDGEEDPLPLSLPPSQLFYRLQESRGLFSTSDIDQESELAPLSKAYFTPRGARSVLVVPLLSGADLQGWILLQSDQVYRFTASEMELARTISNQAATAVQNARLFAETHRLTEDLERRVDERTTEVTREHHNSQTLLRIISELSASLDMNLVLNRTLSIVNESIGSEQSLVVLTQGSGKVYTAGTDLLAMKSDGAKANGRLDQDIARWVVRHRTPALVPDVLIDSRWNPAGRTLTYRSVLAVPLILGEDALGALLLFHRSPDVFVQDQVSLLEATARQIGIALNNADLFNLIRDQAENLGGMLRDQQVAASRSRAILEAVADGVVVTEASNAITLFNASAERILGLKAVQVVGQPIDQFSGLFGKAASTWMQTIRRWSMGEGEYRDGETYAEQLDLDNGRIVQVHLAPVIMRAEFLGTVSIFRDITHEVQVDRLKSEFVANVSHELRTPMTSIKGYVDIMLMGAAGELDPRVKHFLEIVRGNTERLAVLVNDLLDVSKIESGRVTLSLQPLQLPEIASEVIADITRRAGEEGRQMEFKLDAPEGLPEVRGDTERVRQVIGNLVSNGYQYTPDGGTVVIHLHREGEEVQIDIQDNGIGIAKQDQHRMFERFYRGEDPLVLKTAGTGLGLAITRSLVEMHNGRIWFSSSGVRGEGSTFSFTLPVYQS